MSDAPPLSPDCCAAWPQIARELGWFELADWPGIVAMPFINGADGERYCVKHCPSCGSYRMNAVMAAEHMRLQCRTLVSRPTRTAPVALKKTGDELASAPMPAHNAKVDAVAAELAKVTSERAEYKAALAHMDDGDPAPFASSGVATEADRQLEAQGFQCVRPWRIRRGQVDHSTRRRYGLA